MAFTNGKIQIADQYLMTCGIRIYALACFQATTLCLSFVVPEIESQEAASVEVNSSSPSYMKMPGSSHFLAQSGANGLLYGFCTLCGLREARGIILA